MKHLKLSIAWLVMLVLTLTSCSKEESDPAVQDQEKIQLTFGSLLNDMNKNLNKQATPGECREGDPAYVHVGVTDDDGNYIGDAGGTTDVNLIEVDLNWNAAMNVYETVYSDELGVPAGDYQLEHFIVYNESNEVLWVAPRSEGSFEDYVDNPLPQPIDLTAGTKPYITVDVLCYEARSEEAFGYVFFDINLNRVENSYCIFVDFCWDETGRDYPAQFGIEVWSDEYDGTPVDISSDMNSVNTDGELPSASVLCIALPDLGDDTYYARVTLLDYEGAYELDPDLDYIIEFPITQADIDAQELTVPAYTHIRYNCEPPYGEPTCPDEYPVGDLNQDCVVDCRDTNTCPDDPCPGIDPELDINGDCVIDCLDTDTCDGETPGCDDTAYVFGGVELNGLGLYPGNNWGWGLVIGDDNDGFNESEYWVNDRYEFPFIAGAGQNDVDRGWEAGLVIVTIEDGWLHVDFELGEGVTMTESHIWFSESTGEGQWPSSRAHGNYDLGEYSFDLDDPEGDGIYSLIVHSGGVNHPSCDDID